MKQKKTSVILLLALVLQSSLFTACGSEAAPEPAKETMPKETETAVSEEEAPDSNRLYDNLPEADFGGYNFRILSSVFIGRELADFIMINEQNGEKVNDALFKTTSQTSERFNMKFSIVEAPDWGTILTIVRKAVKAGDDSFDIQCGQDQNTISLSKEGMLVNLYDVEQFDFSRPWWPENIMKQLSLAGKLFVGSNYLTYNGLHWTRVLFANKTQLANHGYEVPYEKITNGDWYVEDLLEMVQGTGRDLDGDGKMGSEDFYGYAVDYEDIYCIQDSYGLSFYRKEEDGLYLDVDMERTAQFIEMMKRFKDNTQDCIYLSDTDNQFSKKVIINDQVMFATTQIGTAYDDLRNLSISYALLPFPKLDEKQENYISTCTDAFWAIPMTAYDNLETIGTVIEAMSCLNYQDVLPVYFESALKTRLADSPEDAAMFDILRDTRTIGFEFAFNITFNNIYKTFVNGKTDFASYIEKYRDKAQSNADKLFDKYAEQ